MGDELGVRRMVHRFDAHDPRLEIVLVPLDVPEEVQLRRRRTDDEDLAAIVEGSGDLVKEPMLVVGMVPDADILLVRVTVDVGAWRMNDRLVDLVRVDLEDASLLLSYPYDGVVHGDLPSFSRASSVRARSRTRAFIRRNVTDLLLRTPSVVRRRVLQNGAVLAEELDLDGPRRARQIALA
jgi:hypothetical protein